VATQRESAASQVVPSAQSPVVTQPGTQAVLASHEHGIGSQIIEPPHWASSVHVLGSVLQAPQPGAVPGGAQVAPPEQSACVPQHEGVGQSKSGHAAVSAFAATQPRKLGVHEHSVHASILQPAASRQSPNERPSQSELLPPPHATRHKITSQRMP
jgi:hypothetical protein